ncbi:MAG: Tn3 family transposase [Desulfobacterales bacterium]|nr:Tn3 family transposase [Desulfobacterales bacterium]
MKNNKIQKNLSEWTVITHHKNLLNKVLKPNEIKGQTYLQWLKTGAVSNTPNSIIETSEKLSFLLEASVDKWDLSFLNPNRKKFLAGLGRRNSNQGIQRLKPYKRYPILIAFMAQSLEDVVDELVDLFDKYLLNSYMHSKRKLEKFHLATIKTTQEKLRILQKIGIILLDKNISDDKLREEIYKNIPPEILREILQECSGLIRPKQDLHYDYFANYYLCIRRFIPKFLNVLKFHSNVKDNGLLKAVNILREFNNNKDFDENFDELNLDFIPKGWKPYLYDKNKKINKKYFELCTLWELRGALRSGNIWVQHSRRYADPETYLIPKEQWITLKEQACKLLKMNTGEERLAQANQELKDALKKLDNELINSDRLRIENDKLIVSPLKAEIIEPSCINLQKAITERLPKIELSELLIEVDHWTGFSDCLEHAAEVQPRSSKLIKYLHASILAQSCNLGLKKMAEASDLSYSQLAWHTNWYLSEDTLQACINKLVNYQYHLPISKHWGVGSFSSSDGQRFPVPIKTKNAVALPRYFGYGKGLTFYTWTSDQFSQYGSKVIPSTVRDATYVLDAILDNETELQIMEHTTDTAGYTELIFALFDLLGMQFSPRIRDIGDQRIYQIDKNTEYKNIGPLLKGTIRQDIILNSWDDLLRLAASIKMGWVTASLFIGLTET